MSTKVILLRQFERSANVFTFFVLVFSQLQKEVIPVQYLMIAALSSYILAAALAPPLNKLLARNLRSKVAGICILLATMLIFLPAALENFNIGGMSRASVQGWSIFPLAVYHYCSAVQLMGVIESKPAALLPYAISAVVGIVIGMLLPDINTWVPLGVLFALNIINQFESPGESGNWN